MKIIDPDKQEQENFQVADNIEFDLNSIIDPDKEEKAPARAEKVSSSRSLKGIRPIDAMNSKPFDPKDPDASGFLKGTAASIEGAIKGAKGVIGGLAQSAQGKLHSELKDKIPQSMRDDPSAATKAIMTPPKQMASQLQQQQKAESDRLKQRYPQHQTAVKTGEVLGGIAPFMAIPGLKAASLAGNITRGAALGGLIGGTKMVQDQSQRRKNMLLGGALGGAMAVMGPMLAGIGKSMGRKLVRPFSKELSKAPSRMMMKKEAKRMAETGSVRRAEKVDKATENLGIKSRVSRAEASGSPILRGREQRMRPSEQGLKQGIKATKEIDKSIRKGMIDNIRSVLPKGMGPKQLDKEVQKAYKVLDKKRLSRQDTQKLNKNETIQHAREYLLKDVQGRMGYNAKNFNIREIGQYRSIKRYLDGRISEAYKKGVKEDALIEARDLIQKTLMKSSKDYLKTNKLAQKGIIYKELNRTYTEAGLMGKSGPSPQKLYDAFFGNQAKQRQFLNQIKQGGGNVQSAKDLIRVTSALKTPTIRKILEKETGLITEHSASQGATATVFSAARKLFTQKYHDRLMYMRTNPKYAKEINRLAKLGGKEINVQFPQLLAKVAADLGVSTLGPSGETQEKGSMNSASRQVIDPDTPKPQNLNKVFNPDKMKPAKDIKPGDKNTIVVDKPIKKQLPVKQEDLTKNMTPKKKKLVDRILEMSPEEYYKKVLSDPKKRRAFLKYIHKRGGNLVAAQRAMQQLDKIRRNASRTSQKLSEARNQKVTTAKGKKGIAIIMVLIGALIAASMKPRDRRDFLRAANFGQLGDMFRKQKAKAERESKMKAKRVSRLEEKLEEQMISVKDRVELIKARHIDQFRKKKRKR